MAPEVWAGNYHRSCDVWSCGVILFYLLSGRFPFMSSRLEDFPRLVMQEPTWQYIGGASTSAQEICKAMLRRQEADRPSAPQLLGDGWFAAFGLGTLPTNGKGLSPKQVHSLLNVAERSEFEKFVARLVATQLDSAQQRRLNEVFHSMDVDCDGQLSHNELRVALLQLGGSSPTVERAITELDVGHTGFVTYTEFLAGVVDMRRKSPDEREKLLRLAWQQFFPDAASTVRLAQVQDELAARGLSVADLPETFLKTLSRGGPMTFSGFKELFVVDESAHMLSSFVSSATLRQDGEL